MHLCLPETFRHLLTNDAVSLPLSLSFIKAIYDSPSLTIQLISKAAAAFPNKIYFAYIHTNMCGQYVGMACFHMHVNVSVCSHAELCLS